MSETSPSFAAHLAGDVTTLCQCWKLTRRDGVVAGFTDHDRPLEIDGVAYEPEAGFGASEATASLGLAVDTVEIDGALSSPRLAEPDIEAGFYDGAKVETLLVNWAQPEDHLLTRTAVIGKITRADGRFVAELKSLAESLDRPNGRAVRRGCDAELGDARCGFDLEQPAYKAVATVIATDAVGGMTVSGIDGFEAGWLALGTATWVTGARTGRVDRIIDHARSGEEVRLTLDADLGAVAPGDTLTVRSGCDKRFETCIRKFANELNFRGFPHLPGNDAAYGYATESGNFDGGPLVP